MDSRLRKPRFIFECFVELVRPKEGEEAQITYLFPKDYNWDDDSKKHVPKFAFPGTACNDTEEHFTFVLTDLDGKYRFGFCRYPPRGETCMCFLSDLPWYKVFYRAMDKISDLKLDHQGEIVEPLLRGLRAHSFPTLGTDAVLTVIPDGVDAGQVYTFPLPDPRRLPEIPTDYNLTYFYTSLHYDVILHLFANMIFERRIIITSSSLSLLSACVHGAVLLLYPLFWQHIFIPITPPHLTDYCAAPMPFLMGVHSSTMERVRQMPTDDVVILDVDESTIESPNCEDLLSLPPDIISNLRHVLRKQSSAYGDTVTKAFMLAQVSMLGGYRSALKLRQGEKEVTFDEEAFLYSRPNMEEFLAELLNFQHFRQFINGRIDKLKSQSLERDLFDIEVLAYDEELKGTAQEQIKAVFDKFLSYSMGGSKRLWGKTKEGSEHLAKKAKNYKVVDKGWKTTKNILKESKRTFQGMKIISEKDKVGQGEYDSHVLDNTALLERKANSLPTRTSPGTAPRATAPAGGGQSQSRKPPPVIPYKRHVEGKRKLEVILRQSGILNTESLGPGDVPSGILLSFTPPDTPRMAQSEDQSLPERASLDSRGSTDASVSSGEMASSEIATGNLVDISSEETPGQLARKQALPWEEEEKELGKSSDTESASTVSSSSELCNLQDNWERFDDDDRPPLPPPRSELQHLNTYPDNPSVANPNSLNPFAADMVSGRVSPFDDFSSSIAQSLFDSSKRRSDPFTASTLATMSMDLFKTASEHSESQELPAPLIPSSSGDPTSDLPTSLPRPRSSPQVNRITNLKPGDDSRQFYSGSTPNLLQTGNSSSNLVHVHKSSTSAGNSPTLLQKAPNENSAPKQQLGWASSEYSPTKRPPPPKPQPYSGATVKQIRSRVGSSASTMSTSAMYDPFGGLFGEGGLEAYANMGKSNGQSLGRDHPCSKTEESPLV